MARRLTCVVLLALTMLSACGQTSSAESEELGSIVAELESVLPEARRALLGHRKSQGRSCVEFVPEGSLQDRGNVPARLKLTGGGIATARRLPRGTSPLNHFEALQRRFRPALERGLRSRAPLLERLEKLSERARLLAKAGSAWESVPSGIAGLELPALPLSQPARIAAELVRAAGGEQLANTQRLCAELDGSLFHLADLLRWVQLLDANLLAALEFQARARGLFEHAERMPRTSRYDPHSTLGWFPAGSSILYGERNYYEVERQAERYFGLVDARSMRPRQAGQPAAALYLSPYVRRAFAELGEQLPPEHRAQWDSLARRPYDRSALENLLFRHQRAERLHEAAEALSRLGQRKQLRPHQLLDVLSYRGGGFFSGLEWGDRFRPELMAAASEQKGDDRKVLRAAQAFTFRSYDPSRYQGGTLTLRSALETRSFDCIRATDMIGAIFRNAGRTGFVELRECRGQPPSHTTGGQVESWSPSAAVFAVDGLLPPNETGRRYPDSWFRAKKEYCVELYVRSLDTSLWAGAYLIAGPSAGLRVDAALPYLPERATASQVKAFAGPYPRWAPSPRQD